MGAIFLSASIPDGDFSRDADPVLIRSAVLTLTEIALGRRLIVWGGHPSITPMIQEVAIDLGVEYRSSVRLYQSKYFENSLPRETSTFPNVTMVPAIDADRDKSLTFMRRTMIEENEFDAAVFIGGKEGIFEEFDQFQTLHPAARTILLGAPGGATRQLEHDNPNNVRFYGTSIHFAEILYRDLEIDIDEPRTTEQ